MVYQINKLVLLFANYSHILAIQKLITFNKLH